jgi:hypothetical protein
MSNLHNRYKSTWKKQKIHRWESNFNCGYMSNLTYNMDNIQNYLCHSHFLYTLEVKLKTMWAITGSWEPLVSLIIFD